MWTRGGIVLLFWIGLSARAEAYPEFIAKGYATCQSCHYSASGGGMPTPYGNGTKDSMPSEWRDTWFREAAQLALKTLSGQSERNAKLGWMWHVGADVRLLGFMGLEDDFESEVLVIPMLTEVAAAAGVGPVTAYASLTLRQSPDLNFSAFSREHWLGYTITEQMKIRAGRIPYPFGLNLSDHTAYIRKGLGFGQYDQSYGLILDWQNEHWAFSTFIYAGDFAIRRLENGEHGALFSFYGILPAWGQVGLSLLIGGDENFTRLAGAFFMRWKLGLGFYTLLESAYQGKWSLLRKASLNEWIQFLEAGWYAREWLNLYVRGEILNVAGSSELNKWKVSTGIRAQLLPWLNLWPLMQYEKFDTQDGQLQGFIQLQLSI